jgi:hypothetical protein
MSSLSFLPPDLREKYSLNRSGRTERYRRERDDGDRMSSSRETDYHTRSSRTRDDSSSRRGDRHRRSGSGQRRRSISPSSHRRHRHTTDDGDRHGESMSSGNLPAGFAGFMTPNGPLPVWPPPMASTLSGLNGYGNNNTNLSSGMNATPKTPRTRKPCFHFEQHGTCRRGDACPYEHAQPEQSHVTQETNHDTSTPARDTVPVPPDGAHLTTLRIENILPEHCTLDHVHAYFRRFGTITNISVDVAKKTAIVQFSQAAEAHAAYHCPDAVFGNRFVKVCWHRTARDKEMETEETPILSEADIKAQQRQARLQQILEIQRQKEQLLEKQRQQQQILETQLKRTDLSESDRASLQEALDKVMNVIRECEAATEVLRQQRHDASSDAASSTPSSSTETTQDMQSQGAMLRAKLAALTKEAASLGIEHESYGGTGYRGRGGYSRGGYSTWRGRGRGRGSMTWTPAMAHTSYQLDNRTTKIQVRDVTDEIKARLHDHFSVSYRCNASPCVLTNI